MLARGENIQNPEDLLMLCLELATEFALLGIIGDDVADFAVIVKGNFLYELALIADIVF